MDRITFTEDEKKDLVVAMLALVAMGMVLMIVSNKDSEEDTLKMHSKLEKMAMESVERFEKKLNKVS